MAGKHPRDRSVSFSFSPSSAFFLLLFLIAIGFVFFFFFTSSSEISPNPSSHSLSVPLFKNPKIKPEFSFVASLEKFLTSRSQIPKSQNLPDDSIVADGESVKKLDDLIWKKEMERNHEDQFDPASSVSTVLRVYVYEMPAKFTYDLLWLFRNTYKETSTLTSNGSPVHRLIGQHSIDYWLWADLIAPESERLLKNVVRVHRQEEADLFYIPFFTTISYFLLEKQQCKALYRVWARFQGCFEVGDRSASVD